MNDSNIKRIAHAHETAIAQLQLAAVAVQSAGASIPFAKAPTTDAEVANVMALSDRMAERLKELTRAIA